MCLMLMTAVSLAAQPKQHGLTFDDMIGFGRITEQQISPDGKTVCFIVANHDKIANKVTSNLYLVPVAGGKVKQVTYAKASVKNLRWTNNGKSIAFIMTVSGDAQLFTVPASGGTPRKITSISTGVSDMEVSRDGIYFAFSSEIYPDCNSDESNKKRILAEEQQKSKAKIIDKLPFRVWNAWKDGKRSHVFVMATKGGKALDLTPGDYDAPPIDLGGPPDYNFSPDGKELVFTKNMEPMVTASTNNDLFTVAVTGGTPKNITENLATDNMPTYSRDGKYIAYRSMKRPGFEADKQILTLFERSTGKRKLLTESFDRSVSDYIWSPDSKVLYFTSDDKGNHPIYKVNIESSTVDMILERGYHSHLDITPDGKTLVFTKDAMNAPGELYRMDVDGKNLKKITGVNDERVAKLAMNPAESFWYPSVSKSQVQGFIVKPPFFDQTKKYPIMLLIHGGPQGQWSDQFHYRWNTQMFAARGYVVIMLNIRGSSGNGQKFLDEVSKDWGGKPYVDLMKGVDFVVKTYPFVDGNRIGAAGGSYGGYMVNWINGQTKRFKCLVSHDGIFNLAADYGTTDEQWFCEWEFGGTPYKNPRYYEKWSPHTYAENFKTPTLVIHSQQDFRCDVGGGIEMFTALQRQGVKSKLLYFPDEGHWVMKPANAEVWYRTVLDWVDENMK
jgi:dipeptidyl aminopeptidase/acylaminoacyl peptidase